MKGGGLREEGLREMDEKGRRKRGHRERRGESDRLRRRRSRKKRRKEHQDTQTHRPSADHGASAAASEQLQPDTEAADPATDRSYGRRRHPPHGLHRLQPPAAGQRDHQPAAGPGKILQGQLSSGAGCWGSHSPHLMRHARPGEGRQQRPREGCTGPVRQAAQRRFVQNGWRPH